MVHKKNKEKMNYKNVEKLFQKYFYNKDNKNMLPKTKINNNSIKNVIINSSISMFGHFMAKKILASTWWGTIILFILENSSFTLKPITQPIIDATKYFFAIHEEESNIKFLPEIITNTNETLQNSNYMSYVPEGTIEIAPIILSDNIENNVRNIVNQNMFPFLGTLDQESINNINYIGSGMVYIAIGGFIFMVMGPAATIGATTGLAVTKITSITLATVTSNSVILTTVPKALGVITALYSGYKTDIYFKNSVHKIEEEQENDV